MRADSTAASNQHGFREREKSVKEVQYPKTNSHPWPQEEKKLRVDQNLQDSNFSFVQ
jgi:hypothetical protein